MKPMIPIAPIPPATESPMMVPWPMDDELLGGAPVLEAVAEVDVDETDPVGNCVCVMKTVLPDGSIDGTTLGWVEVVGRGVEVAAPEVESGMLADPVGVSEVLETVSEAGTVVEPGAVDVSGSAGVVLGSVGVADATSDVLEATSVADAPAGAELDASARIA